jgi:hypothetical protein
MKKKCTKCKVEKPADEKHFTRRFTNSDGLSSWCRQCKKENSKPPMKNSWQKMWIG